MEHQYMSDWYSHLPVAPPVEIDPTIPLQERGKKLWLILIRNHKINDYGAFTNVELIASESFIW